MGRATITLEDEGGALRVSYSIDGDLGPMQFDKSSGAHQHCALLLKHIETLAEPMPEGPEAGSDAPEAPLIHVPHQRAIQVVRS